MKYLDWELAAIVVLILLFAGTPDLMDALIYLITGGADDLL